MGASSPPPFGPQLRRARLAAGLGLRQFAGLIDQRASVVSAVEWNERGPFRNRDLQAAARRVLGPALEAVQEASPAAGPAAAADQPRPRRRLLAWRLTGPAADATSQTLSELAAALDALPPDAARVPPRAWTDLEIEWRAEQLRLCGRAAGGEPLDAEAALELAGLRLRVVAGLAPRWSVASCLLAGDDAPPTIAIDRSYADVRPLATYRLALAAVAAGWALPEPAASPAPTDAAPAPNPAFGSADAPLAARFASALLLPAASVTRAAEAFYAEAARGQPAAPIDALRRQLINRLATALAVPAALVELRWYAGPGLLEARLRAAVATAADALPPALPPLADDERRQGRLFAAAEPP